MRRGKGYKYIYGILVVFIGIGFAYLTANLNINGIGSFGSQSWDIHFDNVVVDNTSYNPVTPTVSNDDLTITFASGLRIPGDYYKFNVDIVNDGSLDAMLDAINVTANGDFSDYIDYTITYQSGESLAQYDLLPANSTQTVTVNFFYKDINVEDLPTEEIELSFTLEFNYLMANENANRVYIPVSFADDDWETIIAAVRSGNTSVYHVGDTKTIELGNDLGTHTLRIANMSTPTECSTTGFSQTACGFVLEFADIITFERMNTATNTNLGGWPATEMRTYLNDTNNSESIINSLPSDLRSGIIVTTVVSGHGDNSSETNFTSTDKLYFLATHEVWENDEEYDGINSYDTAYSNTRQLDYYLGLNVTTSNPSGAIKQYDGSDDWYWLRSAAADTTQWFYCVGNVGSYYRDHSQTAYGVSPAFRIG